MNKKIRVTKRQYRRIQEEIDKEFTYLSDDGTKPYDAQVNISADGKIDGIDNGKPVMGDKIQDTLTPQGWNRYRSYGNIYPRTMREGVNIDKEEDDADDIGEVDAFDNKELEQTNAIQIPEIVKERIKLLLDTINQNNLNAKKKGIILNQLTKALSSSSMPYRLQKNIDKNINKNKGLTYQMRKNISNND